MEMDRNFAVTGFGFGQVRLRLEDFPVLPKSGFVGAAVLSRAGNSFADAKEIEAQCIFKFQRQAGLNYPFARAAIGAGTAVISKKQLPKRRCAKILRTTLVKNTIPTAGKTSATSAL